VIRVTGRKPVDQLVYTVPEAGAMLGLSRNGAYEAAKRGEIPTIRIGARLVVPKIAFHRLLEFGASAGNGGRLET
jgi:excisionase family DNA binding protein